MINRPVRRFAMAAIVLMAAIGAWAVSTDRISYVVTHGISMNPVYHQGDLVFVVKADSYQVGQIAAYHGSSPGLKVLHRIIDGDAETGYVFKGDNNQSIDAIRPTAGKLIGRAVLHIPKGGIWLKPLFSPTGLGMIGFLFVGGGAARTRTRREIPRGRRKKKVRAMARPSGSLAMAVAVVTALGRLSLLLRMVAAALALSAGLGIALAAAGWIKPATHVQTATHEADSLTFSYSAQVPRSPAYDGTTVRSPSPVFRKLAHLVDVHMHYLGQPGAFEATLGLSAASGWQTTQKLLAANAFSGNDHDAVVTLDLNAVDAKAEAAGRAIGIQSDSVFITVTARVDAGGKPTITAPLRLTLTPLELALTSGSSLETKSAGATAAKTVRARTIKVLGHPLMTATRARAWSAMLLLTATIGAIAIGLVARRDAPARTRSEIERRYAQFLVHVEPMTSPPGKPVVNVDSFPALAKLAERYGQMILTWRRPEADDFVVRDEGITYRYRIPLDQPQPQPDEPGLHNVERRDGPAEVGSHRRTDVSEMS